LAVRPFVEDDLPQVADLWWKVFRHAKSAAPPSVHTYFRELYVNSPWIDSTTPSLVYEDKSQRIVGFLGGIRRKMSLCGQPIRISCGGNFVVHPDARTTMAGLHLLKTYMAGDQELSLTDSANDVSRNLLERLGFRTIMAFSMSWARALRPAHYAVHAASSMTGPVLSTTLSFAAKPFCSIVDGMAARLTSSPFRLTPSPLHAAELDVETLLQCLAESRTGYSLWPEYDVPTLTWLLTFMEKMHPQLNLRKVLLRDDQERIRGWYVYYVKPGGVAQAAQIGGERKFTKEVLDHLFYDAWKHGAIAIHGVARSDLIPAYWEKKCFFTCRSGWMLAHSRSPELVELLDRGDASFSRLDGEWCLGFEE